MTQLFVIDCNQDHKHSWRCYGAALPDEIKSAAAELDGAKTVQSHDMFLAQPDDGYTPLYVGEPGKYLVVRLED